ncbi:MAG TPA: EAL domain-containing protein [Candidatus Sulfotelmatobacter sp.]
MTMSILETILDRRQLSVRFQPIFRLQGHEKRVDSVEALIRGPKGTNFEKADVLFDYARREGAEAAIDQSCVSAICAVVKALPSEVRINVNVHAATLGHNSGFVGFFLDQVRESTLAPQRFTIEIVEPTPNCNVSELTKSIEHLRAMGARIALDDVGLGQSNYRMMLDCHPEYFKLDAYFVRGIGRDAKRRAVVASLVALAGDLESFVVAEGAASLYDLSELESMGVEFAQADILCPAITLQELLTTGYLETPAVATPPYRQSRWPNARTQTRARPRLKIVGQSFNS